MIDLGMGVFTVSLGILERLLYSWIESRTQRIKLSKVSKEISKAVKAASDQERFRIDDLENKVKQLLEVIIEQTPGIVRHHSGFRNEIVLDYNPKDEKSTKLLLNNLENRFKELHAEYIKVDEKKGTSQNLFVPVTGDNLDPIDFQKKNLDATHEISNPWLIDLQKRIKEREDTRI